MILTLTSISIIIAVVIVLIVLIVIAIVTFETVAGTVIFIVVAAVWAIAAVLTMVPIGVTGVLIDAVVMTVIAVDVLFILNLIWFMTISSLTVFFVTSTLSVTLTGAVLTYVFGIMGSIGIAWTITTCIPSGRKNLARFIRNMHYLVTEVMLQRVLFKVFFFFGPLATQLKQGVMDFYMGFREANIMAVFLLGVPLQFISKDYVKWKKKARRAMIRFDNARWGDVVWLATVLPMRPFVIMLKFIIEDDPSMAKEPEAAFLRDKVEAWGLYDNLFLIGMSAVLMATPPVVLTIMIESKIVAGWISALVFIFMSFFLGPVIIGAIFFYIFGTSKALQSSKKMTKWGKINYIWSQYVFANIFVFPVTLFMAQWWTSMMVASLLFFLVGSFVISLGSILIIGGIIFIMILVPLETLFLTVVYLALMLITLIGLFAISLVASVGKVKDTGSTMFFRFYRQTNRILCMACPPVGRFYNWVGGSGQEALRYTPDEFIPEMAMLLMLVFNLSFQLIVTFILRQLRRSFSGGSGFLYAIQLEGLKSIFLVTIVWSGTAEEKAKEVLIRINKGIVFGIKVYEFMNRVFKAFNNFWFRKLGSFEISEGTGLFPNVKSKYDLVNIFLEPLLDFLNNMDKKEFGDDEPPPEAKAASRGYSAVHQNEYFDYSQSNVINPASWITGKIQ